MATRTVAGSNTPAKSTRDQGHAAAPAGKPSTESRALIEAHRDDAIFHLKAVSTFIRGNTGGIVQQFEELDPRDQEGLLSLIECLATIAYAEQMPGGAA